MLSSLTTSWAKCKYRRYQQKSEHGKHAPPPATTPTHPSMARHHTFKFIWWWHTITIHRLFHSHNLILHWVGRCPYKVWPQWALEVNYCLRVETWPDNLSAAGSGLSKTTVSFPTHTRGTHSFCFTISISSSHLFADSSPFTITPCLCTFAPSFSSFSMTSASPPALSLSATLFPRKLWPLSHRPFTSLWPSLPVPCSKFLG